MAKKRWFKSSLKAGIKLFVILICIVNFFGIYKAALFVNTFDLDFGIIDESKTNMLATTIFIADAKENLISVINSTDELIGSIDQMSSQLIDLSKSSREISTYMSLVDEDTGDFFVDQANNMVLISETLDSTKGTVNLIKKEISNFKVTSDQMIGLAKSQINEMPSSIHVEDKFNQVKFFVWLALIYLAVINLAFLGLAIIA